MFPNRSRWSWPGSDPRERIRYVSERQGKLDPYPTLEKNMRFRSDPRNINYKIQPLLFSFSLKVNIIEILILNYNFGQWNLRRKKYSNLERFWILVFFLDSGSGYDPESVFCTNTDPERRKPRNPQPGSPEDLVWLPAPNPSQQNLHCYFDTREMCFWGYARLCVIFF